MKWLKFFLIIIFTVYSGQIKSQIVPDCDCEDNPEYIISCLQKNQETAKKHQIEYVIHYTTNCITDNYDTINHLVIQFDDSFRLVNYKLIKNGIESLENYFYYDNYGKLICINRTGADSLWVKEKIQYLYSNNQIIERIIYNDSNLVNSFTYIYNDSGRLSKIIKTEQGKSKMIRENFYNMQNLIDSVVYYSFIGNSHSCEKYKYDIYNNEIEKIAANTIKTEYKYDKNQKIVEKRIRNSSFPKLLIFCQIDYDKHGSKEYRIEYNNDTIVSKKLLKYDIHGNMISFKTEYGFNIGKFEKNIYDTKSGLRIYRERNNGLKDIWIYKQKNKN
jgi:YD repeat-containing protein